MLSDIDLPGGRFFRSRERTIRRQKTSKVNSINYCLSPNTNPLVSGLLVLVSPWYPFHLSRLAFRSLLPSRVAFGGSCLPLCSVPLVCAPCSLLLLVVSASPRRFSFSFFRLSRASHSSVAFPVAPSLFVVLWWLVRSLVLRSRSFRCFRFQVFRFSGS